MVFFSSKIGYNISGGSDATMYLSEYLEEYFDELIFVCRQIGDIKTRTLIVIECNDEAHLKKELISLANADTLFYGDFMDAILLAELGLQFAFTYHDNWPDQINIAGVDKQEAQATIEIYQRIFSLSKVTFCVSSYGLAFAGKYTRNVVLVRNGYRKRAIFYTASKIGKPFLMVGNVDSRKYELAFLLFQHLSGLLANDIKVDIYGNILDLALADKLSQFAFVRILGFQEEIPYHHYKALINTSYVENLPISMVEAISHLLPIVTFDVGGIKDLFTSPIGKLIPPYQIERMAEVLLNIDSELGHFDFRVDLSEFDWELAAKKMVAIFNKNS